MSRSWNKAWKNTPRINCGMCGVSTCAAFARAISSDFLSLDNCPILQLSEFEGQRRNLDDYIKQSQRDRVRTAPELPKGGILLTRPCKDTDEKVLAEMRVYNGVEAGFPMHFSVFDASTICDLLECLSTKFDLVKCSRDLGYARAEVDDRSITILQDGRINMRRITDNEQVELFFSNIERSIIGSVICNCCGANLLSILANFENQDIENHPVLNAGSTFSIDKEVAIQKTSKKELLSLEDDDISQIVKLIDELQEFLEETIDNILSMKQKLIDSHPNIEEVRCLIANKLYDNQCTGHVTILLKTLALVWVINEGVSGLYNFESNFTSIGFSRKDSLLKFLSSARKGILERSKEINPGLIISFAHVFRINRAMVLLKRWSE